MASPDGGLISPVSDAALITVLSNFAGECVKLRLKCSPDDIWQALESLAHDAANDLIPIFAKFPLRTFLAEKIQGFDAVICKVEAAVAAIFNLYNLKD